MGRVAKWIDTCVCVTVYLYVTMCVLLFYNHIYEQSMLNAPNIFLGKSSPIDLVNKASDIWQQDLEILQSGHVNHSLDPCSFSVCKQDILMIIAGDNTP